MSQYASALGVCGKCGRDKIQVEEQIKCIFCDYDFNEPKGPVVNIPDPGEEEINRVLSATGVRVALAAKAEKKVETPKAAIVSVPKNLVVEATYDQKIGQALDVLRSLPMPKDIKHFKTVAGVIKKLESLLGA